MVIPGVRVKRRTYIALTSETVFARLCTLNTKWMLLASVERSFFPLFLSFRYA